MPALQSDSVSIAFNGHRVIDARSLTLKPGEVYVVLGSIGAAAKGV